MAGLYLEGLKHGGAYFRNFTVASDTIDTMGLESWLSRLIEFRSMAQTYNKALLKFPKKRYMNILPVFTLLISVGRFLFMFPFFFL